MPWNGIRFDGVGVDIEFKGAMGNNRIWNRNVVAHMNGVRHALGPDYPLAAIPPPPLQMRLAPETWQGFPWAQLGKVSSDIMLMSYWSFRTGCPRIALNCPYEFTKYNVEITRRLTGDRVPIHVIGGVGDGITWSGLNQFVQGAIDAHADLAAIPTRARSGGYLSAGCVISVKESCDPSRARSREVASASE